MKTLVSQGIHTLYIKYKCTAYPCESYHFNYTWKTLAWPHHSTERGSLGILNLFDPVTVKCLTWDREMSGQLCICVCGIDCISVSTIFYLTLKLSDGVVLFIHSHLNIINCTMHARQMLIVIVKVILLMEIIH